MGRGLCMIARTAKRVMLSTSALVSPARSDRGAGWRRRARGLEEPMFEPLRAGSRMRRALGL